MDGDDVGSSVGKRLKIFFWLDDHEMDIDHLGRRGSDRSNDRRADRDVGHEPTVHDVNVNPVCTRSIDRLDFGGQPAKIRRKDGGGDS